MGRPILRVLAAMSIKPAQSRNELANAQVKIVFPGHFRGDYGVGHEVENLSEKRKTTSDPWNSHASASPKSESLRRPATVH